MEFYYHYVNKNKWAIMSRDNKENEDCYCYAETEKQAQTVTDDLNEINSGSNVIDADTPINLQVVDFSRQAGSGPDLLLKLHAQQVFDRKKNLLGELVMYYGGGVEIISYRERKSLYIPPLSLFDALQNNVKNHREKNK